MSEEKKIPEGRFGRLARLSGLAARTGASLLFSKQGTSAAVQAAEVLGNLRGIAAKVGQMASYVDGVVPEDHREAYETALSALRSAAPRSSSASIRAVIEEDLGAPVRELFSTWDDAPIASASIGQVHRAVLASGQEVAVKVQHPGIASAVESDLKNANILEAMVVAFGGRKLNAGAMLEEVKERFREELDYTLEAERQQRFRALHGSDPTIRIPAVFPDRSSRRVLTTEFARGISLEEAAESAPALRRAWAETLWRFVFKGNLVGGAFNADPHPGNYLFQPDGQITFLDFGCVQPIEGKRLTDSIALHKAALLHDDAAFARAAVVILETHGGRYEDLSTAYSRRCFDPIFERPYRITRPYVASLVQGVKDLAMDARTMKAEEIAPLPPGILFMNRLQFGFYSVLARLDVEVDYAAVEQAFLAEAGHLVQALRLEPRV
jgi:predicted unusual protein kinase regulating ubiquinone biosynthesis (AarF/ABC1/UbiB family)